MTEMMSEIIRLNTISDYCERYGCPMMHPLITLVDVDKMTNLRHELKSCGFYCVFFKDKEGKLVYGLNHYEFEEGTLVFVAPDQVFGTIEDDAIGRPACQALLFHPSLVQDTIISSKFKYYSFFAYEANEALRMSPEERYKVRAIFRDIAEELVHPMDDNSRSIVLSYLMLLFSYCTRFYDRQYASSTKVNNQLIDKFNRVLDDYFNSNLPEEKGLPTVGYCARQLSLSPNYFGDLIKKTTGHTAKEHIHMAVVERVKYLIIHTKKSISEIAYAVGFKYPHHLSRVFRHVTGITPIEFRTRR